MKPPSTLAPAAGRPDRPPGMILSASTGQVYRDWLLLFAGSLLLYGLTANRGMQWQDSGYFIFSIARGEIVNPLGLALTHPLHHALGRLFITLPFADPPYAVTLVSAFGAALAVANVYGAARALTQRRAVAFYVAASLAAAHTFWKLATVAEVYTLTAAVFAAECWVLILFLRQRRFGWFVAMWFMNGLGVANHLQAGLTTPVLLALSLYVWRQGTVSVRHLAVAALAWLIGSLPFTGLILGTALASGDAGQTLSEALFGGASGPGFRDQVLHAGNILRPVSLFLAFVMLNFPNLLIPAALRGIVRYPQIGVSPILARTLMAILIVHVVFVARYNVVDQYTFFLPVYVLLCLWASVGAAGLLARWSSRASRRISTVAWVTLIMTPCVYAMLPTVARSVGVLDRVARHKPYRDDYVYLLTPWSVVERSADHMARQAAALAGRDGMVVIEDRMALHAVRYYLEVKLGRAEAPCLRTPITVDTINARAREAYAAGRPVVWIPADIRRVPDAPIPLTRRGDLYLARPPRKETDSTERISRPSLSR